MSQRILVKQEGTLRETDKQAMEKRSLSQPTYISDRNAQLCMKPESGSWQKFYLLDKTLSHILTCSSIYLGRLTHRFHCVPQVLLLQLTCVLWCRGLWNRCCFEISVYNASNWEKSRFHQFVAKLYKWIIPWSYPDPKIYFMPLQWLTSHWINERRVPKIPEYVMPILWTLGFNMHLFQHLYFSNLCKFIYFQCIY